MGTLTRNGLNALETGESTQSNCSENYKTKFRLFLAPSKRFYGPYPNFASNIKRIQAI